MRLTIIRTIRSHLQDPSAVTTRCGLDLAFTRATFEGGDFSGSTFTGGRIDFFGSTFCGGRIDFSRSTNSGGEVFFRGSTFSAAEIDFTGSTYSGGVQPAGGSDVLVRIESDHPERTRSGPSPRPPSAVPQRRVAAPAPRPGPPRIQPQQRRPAPARRPAVRPRTSGPVPQMRALCRSAGDVVSGAVSQLCRRTYGR
ncbi:hypothetical protein ACIOHB_37025 [Streptomyces microflavus]|uniref:hypothetical protein n=1 Tax=Streptomyces microflavus TaxID=1919 RepID=UPI00382960B6